MLRNIHGSIVCNSPKLTMIQIFINRMDKLCQYTMKYYKAMKKNKLMLYESTWVTHINKMLI